MKKQLTAATLVAAACAVPASAQLIAADSFVTGPGTDTYNDQGGYNGANPTVGVTGFSSAWTVGTANLQGSDDTLALAPVTDTYAEGGKGRYLAAGGAAAFRRGFRPIDTYTPVANGEDYFMSFLVNPGGSFQTPVNFGYATIGFTNFFDSQAFANVPGSANVFGLQVGYRGDSTGDDDGFDLIVRARDSSGDLADFDLAPGVANATSLVVLKVTPTAAEDEVTFWVNPTDPSSEAGLTSTAASTGSFDTFALNTPGDMDRLNVLTNGWGRNFFYDEPRLAYDLDSLFNIESQLPGDANGDGTVDLADFGILRANFGTSMSTFEMGDFNGDGNVDLADFGILRANFGATSGSDIAALDAWYVTVVPEPTTLALAGLGGLALLRRRR